METLKPKPVKFWFAIASNPLFTSDDRCVFRVGMCKSYEDVTEPGDTHFFDGTNIELARKQMHELIDNWCNRYQGSAIMDAHEELKKEKVAKKVARLNEKVKNMELIPDSDVDSLSIGGYVNYKGEPAEPEKPKPKPVVESELSIHEDKPVEIPKMGDDLGLIDLGSLGD